MLPSQVLGLVLCAAFLELVPFAPVAAQKPEDQATKLAKATQNPVADLVSLPVQFNFNTGGGFEDQAFFNINFQPVIPIKGLMEKWNIIFRTIVPYVSVPGAGGTRQGGLGDIQLQTFFTPAKSGRIIWGIGPIFSVPTATANSVSTGSWAVGPTGLVLSIRGPWVLGGLINNLWTFSDNGGDPEVNTFSFQPIVNYNFGKGWAASYSPIISANWDAADGEEWTVPLGLGISRTTAFNGQPITLGAVYYHNVEHPTAAAANLFRLSISFLYPSRPPAAAAVP
jgi:hypothetical protein